MRTRNVGAPNRLSRMKALPSRRGLPRGLNTLGSRPLVRQQLRQPLGRVTRQLLADAIRIERLW
jgi:hypothetical protein